MTCKFCDGAYCKNRKIPSEELYRATEFLLEVGKNKNINRATSTYGLKHCAEKWWRKEHFANGEETKDNNSYVCGCTLAFAAQDLGFDMKRCSRNSPNWMINFSSKGLRKMLYAL
jgi:hypothetical protein